MMKKLKILVDIKKIEPEKVSKLREELEKYGTFDKTGFSYQEENEERIKEVFDKYLLLFSGNQK